LRHPSSRRCGTDQPLPLSELSEAPEAIMRAAFTTQRIFTRPGRVEITSGGFRCLHCESDVCAELSGVRNRNHCPYCLSSRHLDQFEPGDRLSACKARMAAVGLTFKRVVKKYAGHGPGELMLVHVCEGCDKVSINRIAADDDAARLLPLLAQAAMLAPSTRDQLVQGRIALLSTADSALVQRCLSGTG
jgi:hypothetical protein